MGGFQLLSGLRRGLDFPGSYEYGDDSERSKRAFDSSIVTFEV